MSAGANPWVRTLASLLVYATIYFLLFRDPVVIALLLAVMILHEAGHYIAMRSFGYTNVRMLFIPLFGAFVSGEPGKVEPGKKMVVLFAGPLPGILLGMIAAWLYTRGSGYLFYQLALMFIFLNVFNLLPVTPMDGGQMLQTMYPGYSRLIQSVFIVMASAGLSYAFYRTSNYVLLLLVLLMWLRLRSIWMGERKSTGPLPELSAFQLLAFTVLWLAFMVLPMITLYNLSRY